MTETLLPFVSFIIPTYNAEKTLENCLDSVFAQDYPQDRFEVLVIDGGSLDKTIEIANKYPVNILHNKKPLPYNQEGKTGGKAIGLRTASGNLIAFVDADNILGQKDWLRKMIQPLIEDSELVACETSRFINEKDSPINRYCSALITKTSRKDPFVLSFSSGIDLEIANKREAVVYRVDALSPPCLANGTVVRKDILQKVGGYDYDWDTGMRMINIGYNKFCKVTNAGIYHQYVESLSALVRKGVWRIRYLLSSTPNREMGKMLPNLLTDRQSRLGLLRDFISGLTLIGPMVYAVRKVKKERDYAWLYHPIIYFVIPMIYMIILSTNRKGIFLLLALAKR